MAVQALIPGVGFVEESQTVQALVPGAGYLNETVSESTGATATLAVTLDNVTVSSAATVAVAATSSITVANVTASSAVTVAVDATSSITVENVTVSSAATSSSAIEATSSITLDNITVSSAATVAVEATSSISVDNVSVSSAATSETPQYGRPISDTDAVGWTPSTPGDLYPMIDEATYSDTDYIYTETADTDAEVGITSLTDPNVSNGHIVRYRARAVNGGQIKIGVYESTTLVQEWTDTLTDEFATIEHVVTNAITDYSVLRLRFTSLMGT